ncbi:uncharacterized protein MONBRDRAFT_33367 [Monosiga brevicollis MX1]|uniref:PID domain-containing protein n=1 Tax=Monosiga brevicollis TaxID=81824 RepID=A9V510_MONBE|nr:uncharacterized protein MONBRDRAFT_33367 [Monosiga brevicollis MX1]EDQ87193.1 predicted protein [Monosiga brevicollis MX1]|eukprot:XP_001747806.1 hypothetical protein [Monosiga brevicollis MX1]
MSFMHQEVKYRGMEPVLGWQPTQAQPRPGLIEANACVKRLFVRPKQSRLSVISCSPDGGLQCVDTSYNPPEVILNNSVYEIAHCGVDVSKPRLFTVIVGKKESSDFFCHVFKCASKDSAARFVKAVASACTLAYQNYQKKKSAASGGRGSGSGAPAQAPARGSVSHNRAPASSSGVKSAHIRSSMRRPVGGKDRREVRNGKPNPKLTHLISSGRVARAAHTFQDSWFRPSMSRAEVASILRGGRIGDFIVRESQTRPGDYAISVQTGAQIWTGLIPHAPRGFQLGERGGVSFAELTDLIAHYAQNTFMNDGNGYPMALNLPDDTAWIDPQAVRQQQQQQQPSRGPPADWRTSQRRNTNPVPVPEEDATFEQIMNGEFNPDAPSGALDDVNVALDEAEHEPAMPRGLPAGADDDDDDDDDEDFVPGDMPASGGAAPGGFGSSGFGDDFDPRTAGVSTDAPTEHATLSEVAEAIFSELADAVDEEDCVGGNDVRPILLRSGLEISMLGSIWMMVDEERRGKLDRQQLIHVLGLISQAQEGAELDVGTVKATDRAPALDDQ